MSLLLNMLSRLVITFLPRSKCLLISWLQSSTAVILEPPKIRSDTVSTVSPSISHEVMGPDSPKYMKSILRGRELLMRRVLLLLPISSSQGLGKYKTKVMTPESRAEQPGWLRSSLPPGQGNLALLSCECRTRDHFVLFSLPNGHSGLIPLFFHMCLSVF